MVRNPHKGQPIINISIQMMNVTEQGRFLLTHPTQAAKDARIMKTR